MAIDDDIRFLTDVPTDPASSWDFDAVITMSGRSLPEIFLGDQQSILRGDQYRLWLRWFLESLLSPVAASRRESVERLNVFESVYKRVKGLYPGIDAMRQRSLTDVITDHLYADIERRRAKVGRDYALKVTKLELIAERTPPRCYICGFPFPKEAIDAFLQSPGADPVMVPTWVDVFRPRLKQRDLSIEIEHVVPVALHGNGQDNLRLACGWCNKYKSSKVSLYEAGYVAPPVDSIRIGSHELHELPNPFWTIRILALRKRCQHPDGCSNTAKNAELFISLLDWGGSPNPMNLAVFCEDHDPIAPHRRQTHSSVEKVWKERKR